MFSFDEETRELKPTSEIAIGNIGLGIATIGRLGASYVIVDRGIKILQMKNLSNLKPMSKFHHDIKVSSSTEQSAICISKDGRVLAVSDENGLFHILKLPRYEVLLVSKIHTSSVSTISLSNDGQIACSIAHDRVALIWHTMTGKPIQTIRPFFGSSIRSMRLINEESTNALYLFAAECAKTNGWLTIYRYSETTQMFEVCHDCIPLTYDQSLVHMALHQSNSSILVSLSTNEGHMIVLKWLMSSNTLTKLFMTESGKSLFRLRTPLPPHELPITGMTFSKSGRYLIASAFDKSITVWDTQQQSYSTLITLIQNCLFFIVVMCMVLWLKSHYKIQVKSYYKKLQVKSPYKIQIKNKWLRKSKKVDGQLGLQKNFKDVNLRLLYEDDHIHVQTNTCPIHDVNRRVLGLTIDCWDDEDLSQSGHEKFDNSGDEKLLHSGDEKIGEESAKIDEGPAEKVQTKPGGRQQGEEQTKTDDRAQYREQDKDEDEEPLMKPDEEPLMKPDEEPLMKPDEEPLMKPDENEQDEEQVKTEAKEHEREKGKDDNEKTSIKLDNGEQDDEQEKTDDGEHYEEPTKLDEKEIETVEEDENKPENEVAEHEGKEPENEITKGQMQNEEKVPESGAVEHDKEEPEQELAQGDVLHENKELENGVVGNSTNKLQEDHAKRNQKQLENGLTEHHQKEGENETTKLNEELKKELADHEERIDNASAEDDAMFRAEDEATLSRYEKTIDNFCQPGSHCEDEKRQEASTGDEGHASADMSTPDKEDREDKDLIPVDEGEATSDNVEDQTASSDKDGNEGEEKGNVKLTCLRQRVALKWTTHEVIVERKVEKMESDAKEINKGSFEDDMAQVSENLKRLKDDSLSTDQIGSSSPSNSVSASASRSSSGSAPRLTPGPGSVSASEKADERRSESSRDLGPRVTPAPASMTRSAEREGQRPSGLVCERRKPLLTHNNSDNCFNLKK